MIAIILALGAALSAAAAAETPHGEVELRDVQGKWLGHDDEAGETPLVTAVVRNRTANRCVSSATARVQFLGTSNEVLLEQETELLVHTVHYKPVNERGDLNMDYQRERVVLLHRHAQG